MPQPRVALLGEAMVTFAGVVPRFPRDDSAVELVQVSVQPGGAAATAAACAAALGCRARLCTTVADDFLARFLLQALRDSGIEVHAIQPPFSRLSGFRFQVSTDDANQSCFVTRGDVASLAGNEVPVDALLAQADALMLDGTLPEAQVAVAEAARARQIPVIFDGSDLREGVAELIGLADVFLCSERLASELAPRGELTDSLGKLQRMGPHAVVVTLGKAGSVGQIGDEVFHQPGFAVDLVDSAGAGDVFHGAFVTAWVTKRPFPRCLEFACAAAALSCRTLGAWAGIPTGEEVGAFLRQQRGDEGAR